MFSNQYHPSFSSCSVARLFSNTCQSFGGSVSVADDYETVVDSESGISTRKRSLVLHPMAETVPALRIRLLPEAFHAKPGNAATYYLKATGFFEQNAARDELSRLQKEAATKAKEQGKELADVAPYSYLEMAPSELPVEEVRKYLELFRFQPFLLEEARMRSVFEMDRNIKESDNPIGYLLPRFKQCGILRELRVFAADWRLQKGKRMTRFAFFRSSSPWLGI